MWSVHPVARLQRRRIGAEAADRGFPHHRRRRCRTPDRCATSPISHADSASSSSSCPGPPPRVAGKHARARRGRCPAPRRSSVRRRRQIQAVADRSILRRPRAARRPGSSRAPAAPDRRCTAAARCRRRPAASSRTMSLRRHIGRAIQHEAERAVGRVVAEQHHGPREVRILQLRHRQQQRRLKIGSVIDIGIHRRSFPIGPGDVLGDQRIAAESAASCALQQRRPPPESPLLPIATARLRRSRRTPARFIALPFSSARSSSSVRCHRSSSGGASRPSRGCQAGSADDAGRRRQVPRTDLLADVAAVHVLADRRRAAPREWRP